MSQTLPPTLALPAEPASHPPPVVGSFRRRTRDSLDPPAERLFDDATQFDFFQAVWLLERMEEGRRPVGLDGAPSGEIVRFRAHQSLSFPPSAVYELQQGTTPGSARTALAEPTNGPPRLTVTFMGLTGSSGVLPRHYTELLLRLEREAKGAEKHALREWLDLFNHRLISLFYRAWEKYRFYISFPRGEHQRGEPDSFTRSLWSLIGLGQPSLRKRLRVSTWQSDGHEQRTWAGIEDLGLLRYAGSLAQRPRCATNLENLLTDFFSLPVRVLQFQDEWLCLEPAQQTCLGTADGNCCLGSTALVGDRVWDLQGRIRLRLGPLSLEQFNEFLPDRQGTEQRKAQFLLAHLTRFYIGPDIDFDVQLVLRSGDVPQCQLSANSGLGARLGWNTWLMCQPAARDAADATFAGDALRWLETN